MPTGLSTVISASYTSDIAVLTSSMRSSFIMPTPFRLFMVGAFRYTVPIAAMGKSCCSFRTLDRPINMGGSATSFLFHRLPQLWFSHIPFPEQWQKFPMRYHGQTSMVIPPLLKRSPYSPSSLPFVSVAKALMSIGKLISFFLGCSCRIGLGVHLQMEW
jgi:hypothetical protein